MKYTRKRMSNGVMSYWKVDSKGKMKRISKEAYLKATKRKAAAKKTTSKRKTAKKTTSKRKTAKKTTAKRTSKRKTSRRTKRK
jgi:hypothetical protein